MVISATWTNQTRHVFAFVNKPDAHYQFGDKKSNVNKNEKGHFFIANRLHLLTHWSGLCVYFDIFIVDQQDAHLFVHS